MGPRGGRPHGRVRPPPPGPGGGRPPLGPRAAITGTAASIDAEAAADSVDEILAITLPWGVRADKPLAGTVHLHCTDVDGEWFIAADGQVDRTHAKGDVAIRGTASDLLLGLYTRVPLEELDVIGDAALARELLDRINAESMPSSGMDDVSTMLELP